MQISLILGIILGFASVVVGMILKGANVAVLLNPAAATIIFVGIIATLLNTFSSTDVKRLPGIVRVLFKNRNKTFLTQLPKLLNYQTQLGVMVYLLWNQF